MACAVPAGHDRPTLRTRDAFGWAKVVRHSAAASGFTARMSQDQALASDMAAAQAGDAEAYRRLLRDCLPVIAGMVRAQGVRADAVDDVVQDVLLTIHRARATYDPARPFLPWLRAITQRRAIAWRHASGSGSWPRPSPPCRKASARPWSTSPCRSAAWTRRPP